MFQKADDNESQKEAVEDEETQEQPVAEGWMSGVHKMEGSLIAEEQAKEKETEEFQINFKEMMDNYKGDHSKKIPFPRSEFIYCCKIGPSEENEDPSVKTQFMLTMEKVQKPNDINYKGIQTKRLTHTMNQLKNIMNRQLDIADAKEESLLARDVDNDLSEDEDLTSLDSSAVNAEENEGFDGNMFSQSHSQAHKLTEGTPIDYGIQNEERNSKETVLVSIWEIGGTLLRYRRVYSSLVPYPPIDEDRRCYLSHSESKKAVYWIAYKNKYLGEKCLVVFNHIDFDHEDVKLRKQKPFKVYDIDFIRPITAPLATLEGSALIKQNTVLVCKIDEVAAAKKEASKGKNQQAKPCQSFTKTHKWVAWHLKEKRVLWEMDATNDRIFFKQEQAMFEGINADEEKDMFVLQRRIEEEEISQKTAYNDGTEDDKAEDKGPTQKERWMYFRYYKVKFGTPSEAVTEGELLFESSEKIKGKPVEDAEESAMQRNNTSNIIEDEEKQVKLDKGKEKKAIRGQMLFGNVAAKLNLQHLEDDASFADVKYAHNFNMSIFIIIIVGQRGEQHKIKRFDLEYQWEYAFYEEFDDENENGTAEEKYRYVQKRQEYWADQKQRVVGSHRDWSPEFELKEVKPGGTKVEFNQNSHASTVIFLITSILKTNQTSCRPIMQDSFTQEENAKGRDCDYDVKFNEIDQFFPKEAWLVFQPLRSIKDPKKAGCKKDDWDTYFMQICTLGKSSGNAYMNCTMQLKPEKIDGDTVSLLTHAEAIKKYETKLSMSMKSQHIFLNYPLICSNIGDNIVIQSLTQPNLCAMFGLDWDETFIDFINYYDMAGIGKKDDRKRDQQNCPLHEAFSYVAFAVKKTTEDKQKNMFIKLLEIDPYSNPITYKSYDSVYNAYMCDRKNEGDNSEDEEPEGGVRDDVTLGTFSVQITSRRGCDQAFVSQYNDCIIFDCITHDVQRPIQIPLLSNYFDSWMNFESIEQYKVCKSGEMCKVKMLMTAQSGSIIWLMYLPESKEVIVMMTNKEEIMGLPNFVKEMYRFRSDFVYFAVLQENKGQDTQLVIMDQKKAIRFLRLEDEDEGQFVLEKTLFLQKKDREAITYSAFDDYNISGKCLQWRSHLFFLHSDPNPAPNKTWASENFVDKEERYAMGPFNLRRSNMIAYISTNIGMVGGPKKDQPQALSIWGKKEEEEEQVVQSQGYFITVGPNAETPYFDLIPQHAFDQNNNMVTYINKDDILCHYSGRYLVFKDRGYSYFDHIAQFEFLEEYESYSETQLTLLSISENVKYFVFIGPASKADLEKAANEDYVQYQPRSRRASKKKKKGPRKKQNKAKHYYVFELCLQSNSTYFFKQKRLDIRPTEAADIHPVTMCITGQFHKHTIIQMDPKPEDRKVIQAVISVETQQVAGEQGEVRKNEYTFDFDRKMYDEKQEIFKHKVKHAQKNQLQIGDEKEDDRIAEMNLRQKTYNRAWTIGPYLIVRSGIEIKYIKIQETFLDEDLPKEETLMNLKLEGAIWIQNVFPTGVSDMIQLLLVDDIQHLIYVITWNLAQNREHSMYQTKYKEDTWPETSLVQSLGTIREQNFNAFIDECAIVNLDANVPAQFFFPGIDGDLVPKGFKNQMNVIGGQKRLSDNHQKFLDINNSGRLHHFHTFTDLMYWKRFEELRKKHELYLNGKIEWNKILRYPQGISIFHIFSTNIKLLESFNNSLEVLKKEHPDQKANDLYPLIALHRRQQANRIGTRQTPIHLSFENKNPKAQDLMLEAITGNNKVYATRILMDVLDEMLESCSPAVLNFFNEGFLITDQFKDPKMLVWNSDEDKIITQVPTSFLSDRFLKQIVSDFKEEDEEEENEQKNDNYALQSSQMDKITTENEHIYYYDVQKRVECVPCGKEESIKTLQVEAKLLNFDWIFIGDDDRDNVEYFIKLLAEIDQENDNIFSQAQIGIFINHVWGDYGKNYKQAIMFVLVIPYFAWFISFLLYAMHFADAGTADDGDLWSFNFIGMWVCILVFGKMHTKFILLNAVQMASEGSSYFLQLWNWLEMINIGASGFYVLGNITSLISPDSLNVIGSFSVLMFFIKCMYYLRVFEDYAIFIRMIIDMISAPEMKQFWLMLFVCLEGFALIIIVLNFNRGEDDQIYDGFLGVSFVDAFLQAWLLGLGEFGYDNYSAVNAPTTWFFFVMATIIVQLVFMNLLVAIMSDQYAKVNEMKDQNKLKEMCKMIHDHTWLLRTDEIFSKDRYILVLGPNEGKKNETQTEKKIQELRDLVEQRVDKSDEDIGRNIRSLSDTLISLQMTQKQLQTDSEKQLTSTSTDLVQAKRNLKKLTKQFSNLKLKTRIKQRGHKISEQVQKGFAEKIKLSLAHLTSDMEEGVKEQLRQHVLKRKEEAEEIDSEEQELKKAESEKEESDEDEKKSESEKEESDEDQKKESESSDDAPEKEDSEDQIE